MRSMRGGEGPVFHANTEVADSDAAQHRSCMVTS